MAALTASIYHAQNHLCPLLLRLSNKQKYLKLTLSELIQKKNIRLLGSQVVVIRGEEIMIPGYLNARKYPDSRDIPNIYSLLLLLTNIPF